MIFSALAALRAGMERERTNRTGTRRASIKETGEQLTPAEWERFDAAVADDRAKRPGQPSEPPDAPTRLPGEAPKAG